MRKVNLNRVLIFFFRQDPHEWRWMCQLSSFSVCESPVQVCFNDSWTINVLVTVFDGEQITVRVDPINDRVSTLLSRLRDTRLTWTTIVLYKVHKNGKQVRIKRPDVPLFECVTLHPLVIRILHNNYFNDDPPDVIIRPIRSLNHD